jgi:hypothetical protein
MSEKNKLPRRDFLKQAAVIVGAATQGTVWPTHAEAEDRMGGASGQRKNYYRQLLHNPF